MRYGASKILSLFFTNFLSLCLFLQKNNIQNTLRNVESLTSNIDSISYAIEKTISQQQFKEIKSTIEDLSQSGKALRETSQLVNLKIKEDLEKRAEGTSGRTE